MKIKKTQWKKFARSNKKCHYPTARNNNIFTKDVPNAIHQNHCTSDIYATLVAIFSLTMRPNKNSRRTDCKDHRCLSSCADNARIVGEGTSINGVKMSLVQLPWWAEFRTYFVKILLFLAVGL
jgi:hypothetical protein